MNDAAMNSENCCFFSVVGEFTLDKDEFARDVDTCVAHAPASRLGSHVSAMMNRDERWLHQNPGFYPVDLHALLNLKGRNTLVRWWSSESER